MNRLTIALILVTYIYASGQSVEEQQRADYVSLVWSSNMPDELRDFYDQEKIRTTYRINKDLNPFYLRGDFDGDKKMDYALAVVEIKTDKKGILIYHSGTKMHFILGAGHQIRDGYESDDMNWMDAWNVHDKKDVELGVGETKIIKLKGEAIHADKLESSSGLIYWDGKEYRWYQQGD
jgi:hypothetical protein